MVLCIYQCSISYLPNYLNNNILCVELKMSNLVAIINSLTIVKISDESITDGRNSARMSSQSLSVKKKNQKNLTRTTHPKYNPPYIINILYIYVYNKLHTRRLYCYIIIIIIMRQLM